MNKDNFHGWCENAGRFERREHVVKAIRGVTQLACRLKNVDDPSCTWMLRATHSSDDSRAPFSSRRSERVSARRLIRGSPDVPESVDFWPGFKAAKRAPAVLSTEEPMAEPMDVSQVAVVLRSDMSPHARRGATTEVCHSPPPCVRDFFRGADVLVPPYPLCDLGLRLDQSNALRNKSDPAPWWIAPFQMGRMPFDTKYCAARRSFSE